MLRISYHAFFAVVDDPPNMSGRVPPNMSPEPTKQPENEGVMDKKIIGLPIYVVGGIGVAVLAVGGLTTWFMIRSATHTHTRAWRHTHAENSNAFLKTTRAV